MARQTHKDEIDLRALPEDVQELLLTDYNEIRVSCQSGAVTILEGRRKESGITEMLQMTALSNPSMVGFLRKEFELCAADPICPIHAIDSGIYGEYWLQRFSEHGETLYKHFVSKRPYIGGVEGLDVIAHDLPPIIHRDLSELLEILDIACKLCLEIQALHSERLLHNSINPFVVYIVDGRVVLHGKFLLQNMDGMLDDDVQQGQNLLPYLSPESSGRLNRVPDNRSDIYSIGCTLFEILLGRPPYLASDPLTYIHRHLTAKPPRIDQISSSLPKELGEILSKCLEKSPDARYQTVAGLRHDLEQVSDLLRHVEGTEFRLGALDELLEFQPNEQLCGRDTEVQVLRSILTQVKHDRRSHVVLITGTSGIGKSRLASTLSSHTSSILSAAGKYEQYRRGIPYYVLSITLQTLIRQILSQAYNDIHEWRDKLLENSQAVSVLAEYMPEIVVLLGEGYKFETPASVSVHDARKRFHDAVIWFLTTISQRQTIVLFQDDIQWAGQGELDLTAEIAAQVPNLLLLLARRPPADIDSITFVLDSVRTTTACTEMALENLKEDEVKQLIVQTLHGQTSGEIDALSSFTYNKTQGNPFFVTQTLISLHRGGKIHFQLRTNRWRFDIKSISDEELTESIIQIIIAQMRALPQQTQDLLVVAAALGQERFSVRALCDASGLSLDEAQDAVNIAVDSNLLKHNVSVISAFSGTFAIKPIARPAEESISFIHDRTQESAYALVDAEQQSLVHYTIARNLRKCQTEALDADSFFILANQYNRCLNLLSLEEREYALDCNVQAGSHALKLSDAASALHYFDVAEFISMKLDCSDDLKIRIQLLLIEVNFASNKYSQVLDLVDKVAPQCHKQEERTRCYIYRMNVLIVQGQMMPAIDAGLEALNCLGCPIPTDDAESAKFAKDIEDDLKHDPASIVAMHSLGSLTDARLLQVQEVISIIVLPVYMSRPDLLSALCYLSVSITAAEGISMAGAYPAMMLGAWLTAVGGMNNLQAAYAYGRFALTILDTSDKLESMAPAMYHLFAGHIAVFHASIQEVMKYEDLAIATGKALFNVDYTVFSLVEKPIFLCWTGTSIQQTGKELIGCSGYVRKLKSEASSCFLAVFLRGVAMLACDEAQEKQARQLFPLLNEVDAPEAINKAISPTHAFMTELWTLIVNFLLRKDNETRKAALRCCVQYGSGVLGTFYETMALYISSLTFLRLQARGFELTEVEESIVNRSKTMLRDYSTLSPSTYAAKYMLVEILMTRGTNQLEILDQYDATIETASRYKCYLDEALALESASRWLKTLSNKRSQIYMQRSYNAYKSWGCLCKLRQLESEFPWLVPKEPNMKRPMYSRENTHESATTLGSNDHIWRSASTISSSARLTPRNKRVQAQASIASDRPPQWLEARSHIELGIAESKISADDSTKLSDLDLKTVLNASIQISQGMKAEEVFESLMRTVILAAGADYGVLALYSIEEVPKLDIHTIAEDEEIQLKRNTRAHDCPDLLPLSIIDTVIATQRPIIRDEASQATFDESFGRDKYFRKRQKRLRSVLCMPITSSSENKCRGVLYLENNATTAAFTNQRLECLTLLSTQSAMTLERATVYQELRAAKAQAEEATAQKSTFLANMSHEIRTPFNALLSCAIFLLDTGLTQVQKDYVTTIRDSATLTLSIIDSILDFSKVEQGMMDLVLSPCSLSETIETALQVVAEKASKNGIDLAYHRKHQNDRVIADFHHLRQVILNLLGNAVKFTSEGYVKVTTETKERTDTTHQVLLIRVQDTGIGISQKGIERLFKAFSQVDASINRSYGGTGLGLAISKKLLELMHGKIWLESIEGTGTTFHIELPVEIDVKEDQAMSMQIAESKALRDQGRLGLVISRFPETAHVLCDDLEDIGIIADANTEILDPDSIAEAAKAKPYSILFVDLQVDGALELIRSLQKILPSTESHFKIVVLTHYGLNVPKDLPTDRISGYLVKPVAKKKLKSMVSSTLDAIWGSKTEHPSSAKKMKKNKDEGSHDQKQLRILLAEDNIINTKVAIQHLKRLGHTNVTHAKDGIEVLELVAAADKAKSMFDIILMDVQMPRLDGVGATQQLVKLYPTRSDRPLIIALTANATSTDKEKCINAGMSGHIAKPILPDELARTLNAVQRRASLESADSGATTTTMDIEL